MPHDITRSKDQNGTATEAGTLIQLGNALRSFAKLPALLPTTPGPNCSSVTAQLVQGPGAARVSLREGVAPPKPLPLPFKLGGSI